MAASEAREEITCRGEVWASEPVARGPKLGADSGDRGAGARSGDGSRRQAGCGGFEVAILDDGLQHHRCLSVSVCVCICLSGCVCVKLQNNLCAKLQNNLCAKLQNMAASRVARVTLND